MPITTSKYGHHVSRNQTAIDCINIDVGYAIIELHESEVFEIANWLKYPQDEHPLYSKAFLQLVREKYPHAKYISMDYEGCVGLHRDKPFLSDYDWCEYYATNIARNSELAHHWRDSLHKL